MRDFIDVYLRLELQWKTDGHVRFLFRLFIVWTAHFVRFFSIVQLKLISFILKITVNFLSTSFVFSLNDCLFSKIVGLIKLFVNKIVRLINCFIQWNCPFNKIVRTINCSLSKITIMFVHWTMSFSTAGRIKCGIGKWYLSNYMNIWC